MDFAESSFQLMHHVIRDTGPTTDVIWIDS